LSGSGNGNGGGGGGGGGGRGSSVIDSVSRKDPKVCPTYFGIVALALFRSVTESREVKFCASLILKSPDMWHSSNIWERQ
jgi:hypothetical protein